MENLSDFIGKGYNFYLDSSVFKELTTGHPHITIWFNNQVIVVTSKNEYNNKKYFYKTMNMENVIKPLADVSDYDKAFEIYEIGASSYTTTTDYKLEKINEVLQSKKLTRK